MAIYSIFIGTYSKGPDGGLFRCSFNDANGEIHQVSTIDIENPSYLQINNNILYGVSELDSFNDENGGALFSVDVSNSKEMNLLDIKATHGKHPCHLYLKDNYIFVSNYTEGSLSIFETDISGHLKSSHQSLHHFGQGARQDRQKSSHIHFAAITPDDKYLALCDLGMDKVFLYPYSSINSLSTNAKMINCRSGSGPRHLTFSACGNYIYILTELDNTVLCCQYNNGDVKILQEISTLPEDFSGSSIAAAIHLSPCGRFVAASNRGHDSIVLYKTLNNGKLVFSSHVMTGREPRDFKFSPCGKWLLSANQNDDSVTIFKIANNSFIQTGVFYVPKPVCIIFGKY